MPGHYVLKKTAPQQYSFVLRAENNEPILVSETYTSKPGARSGIASCQLNSPNDQRYVRKTSTAGQPFFVLHGANGEPIGSSEMYSSVQAREQGILSTKRHGPTDRIVDNTGE